MLLLKAMRIFGSGIGNRCYSNNDDDDDSNNNNNNMISTVP